MNPLSMSDCCGGKILYCPLQTRNRIGLTKNSGYISKMIEFPLHALTNHNTLCTGPRNWTPPPIK